MLCRRYPGGEANVERPPALKDGAILYRPFRGVTVYIAPSGAWSADLVGGSSQRVWSAGLVCRCLGMADMFSSVWSTFEIKQVSSWRVFCWRSF